jgi:hypothetical protein
MDDGLPYDFVVFSRRESFVGSDASFDEVSRTTSNSATIKGLLQGETYIFKVQATSKCGRTTSEDIRVRLAFPPKQIKPVTTVADNCNV